MELDAETVLRMRDYVSTLDTKLAYIQLLLERMEELARRVASGEVPPEHAQALQAQFDDLVRDIDRVASTMPAPGSEEP